MYVCMDGFVPSVSNHLIMSYTCDSSACSGTSVVTFTCLNSDKSRYSELKPESDRRVGATVESE